MISIRKLKVFIFYLVLLPAFIFAKSSYDLRIIESEQQQITESGHFDVVVQIKCQGDPFSLGSSNLVFSYNSAVLAAPHLIAASRYSDGKYYPMTVTEPVRGRVSINIELRQRNDGIAVSDEFEDVVTIRFSVNEMQVYPSFDWRTVAPNPTVVFAEDEWTIVNYGNFQGLVAPLKSDPAIAGKKAAGPATHISGNYPNPFNPETVIGYSLSADGAVALEIYDIAGSRVRTLVKETQAAGRYSIRWDGTTQSGRTAASGIYLVRLVSAGSVQHHRIMLLK